jgi:hypothetical protein
LILLDRLPPIWRIFPLFEKNSNNQRTERIQQMTQRTHGGKREGAGRKPKPPPKIGILASALTHKDPKAFLITVMNDADSDARLRIDAAKALLPFMHAKPGEGKKEEKQSAAKTASKGKFAPSAPPRLKQIP